MIWLEAPHKINPEQSTLSGSLGGCCLSTGSLNPGGLGVGGIDFDIGRLALAVAQMKNPGQYGAGASPKGSCAEETARLLFQPNAQRAVYAWRRHN